MEGNVENRYSLLALMLAWMSRMISLTSRLSFTSLSIFSREWTTVE